jgi:hypothetical protein
MKIDTSVTNHAAMALLFCVATFAAPSVVRANNQAASPPHATRSPKAASTNPSSARIVRETGTSTWTNLIPTGGLPPPRAAASAVYDPISDNMTIFGGVYGQCNFGDCFNDVWVLSNADGNSPATWQQLSPGGTPPSPRGSPVSVYDPGTNNMIMFGGDPNEGYCFEDANDTWVLSNANGIGPAAWTQLNPYGPLPQGRQSFSGVYDVTTNRLIIFGGVNGCAPQFNDVWVLSNANGLGGTPAWTQLAPGGPLPAPRAGHVAVYDPNSNRMIVYSGDGLADLWVLTDANGLAVDGAPQWIQLFPSGTGPGSRGSASAVYDSATNSMTIFGGNGVGKGCSTSTSLCNDTWVLSNANGLGGQPRWSKVKTSGGPPSQRNTQTAVFYNPARDRMITFAGQTAGSVPQNDTWVLTDVP